MLKIKKMTKSDAPEVMKLIQSVYDQMEHKEWYAIDDEDYYAHYLEAEHGIGYKAVDEESGSIAGLFIALFPDKKEVNLGYDAGLNETACERTAVMETAAVLPAYRGQNLQYRLMQAAEQDLKDLGYRYLTATIHPDNRYSLHNALKQGYEIVNTKEKYGGYLRHILCKKLGDSLDC